MNADVGMTAPSLFCVLVAGCTTISAVDAPVSRADVPVERFLDFYFHKYKRGLPQESQLPDLAAFTTPELLELFEAAMRGEECYLRKNDYEGPSPIQGDLFSSLFEGATSATYRHIGGDADAATIEIEWTNDTEWLSPEATVWQDRVYLVNSTNGWRIADFAHDGDWDFMMKGSVAEILREVSKECSEKIRVEP